MMHQNQNQNFNFDGFFFQYIVSIEKCFFRGGNAIYQPDDLQWFKLNGHSNEPVQPNDSVLLSYLF